MKAILITMKSKWCQAFMNGENNGYLLRLIKSKLISTFDENDDDTFFVKMNKFDTEELKIIKSWLGL